MFIPGVSNNFGRAKNTIERNILHIMFRIFKKFRKIKLYILILTKNTCDEFQLREAPEQPPPLTNTLPNTTNCIRQHIQNAHRLRTWHNLHSSHSVVSSATLTCATCLRFMQLNYFLTHY